MADKYLSDKQLAEYCSNFTGLESEGEEDMFDDDSLDDPTFEPDVLEDILEKRGESDEEENEIYSETPLPSCSTTTLASATTTTRQSKPKNITWKRKHIQLNEEQFRFHGNY